MEVLLEPLFSCFSAQPIPDVHEDVGALLDDVLAQELAGDRVSSFDAPVAAGSPVAAQHHQIPADVIARVLEDVVQREAEWLEVRPETDRPADRAFLPLAMERLQERSIANASLRLRVYQYVPFTRREYAAPHSEPKRARAYPIIQRSCVSGLVRQSGPAEDIL